MSTRDTVRAVFARTPLAEPMADPRVTEIMINGSQRIFIERDGRKHHARLRFDDAKHLAWFVERLLELNPGRRLDALNPFADLALPDGSRVNVAIEPVVTTGTHVTIRKYSRVVSDLDDYVRLGSLDGRMAQFLRAATRARLNVLFSGASGSGKTTLLEILAQDFSRDDRVVVIEDTPELHLSQPNVVRMLTRMRNVEGAGAIGFDELFRNSLRMRPSRILLGEIRGPEAVSYLQAINSGHRGSMAIIHASTPHEAVLRIENLVASSGIPIPRAVARQQIAHGVDLIVQITQLPDGVRRITRITEVANVEGALEPELRHLFGFRADGVDADGHVVGAYVATGNRPTYPERFAIARVRLDPQIFDADPGGLDSLDRETLPGATPPTR